MDTELKAKAETIISEIEKYDKIVILRHLRPDGDAFGSAHGLCEIIKASFDGKKVYAVGDDFSEDVAFMGSDDIAPDGFYDGALCIVTDTGSDDRISGGRYGECKEIIRIDHHIEVEPYGDITLIDEKRSSCSEIVADMCYSFPQKLKMTKKAAEYLYFGIVTDTARFKFSPNKTTFEIAGRLLSEGVDAGYIYTMLDVHDRQYYENRVILQSKIKYTKNGVAYLVLPLSLQKELNMSRDEASASLSMLEGIKGSMIWMAIIENPDVDWRVRLRSRKIEINALASKYRGGGHIYACGATLKSEDEITLILNDADEILKEYKKTHPEEI